MDDQEKFSKCYVQGKVKKLPPELPLVRCSASGAEVHECRLFVFRPRIQEEFDICGMCLGYAELTWRRYLLDGTYVKSISTFGKQDAKTKRASPIASAAVSNVVDPAKRLLSNSAMISDGEAWKMDNLVEI